MGTERNKELSRRWFEEVWNQQRAETIDELIDPDAIVHGLDPAETQPAADIFRKFWERFCGAFPDLHIHVDEVIGEGESTAVRVRFRGTHTGEHLGAPATGQPITATALVLLHWRDGRVIESWNEFDALGIFQKAGLVQMAQVGA